MARVKGGVTGSRRRKRILAETKGYRFGRSTKVAAAREAIYHAQSYAFAHRKERKNDFRRLWTSRMNAALKQNGLRYNAFIKTMSDKGVELNRKMLATLAKDNPEAFTRVVEKITK